jgi:hypothetical protein
VGKNKHEGRTGDFTGGQVAKSFKGCDGQVDRFGIVAGWALVCNDDSHAAAIVLVGDLHGPATVLRVVVHSGV